MSHITKKRKISDFNPRAYSDHFRDLYELREIFCRMIDEGTCGICSALLLRTHTTECGHSFCTKCTREIFRGPPCCEALVHAGCPICRRDITCRRDRNRKLILPRSVAMEKILGHLKQWAVKFKARDDAARAAGKKIDIDSAWRRTVYEVASFQEDGDEPVENSSWDSERSSEAESDWEEDEE
ncbi:RING finger protein PSH1 [Colletotrichum shisoi]|uniref:RING finger protein PSH1 n=1 Tax=Colletotrichum shisoi TaxID=2078593 RepID=A0A5Q4C3T1_9PEZI|nr:RING finger protein PSH1 [Colletotrichum shisoi]